MDTFGTIFAGLGLFFIGVKLISGNLKEMSGGAFRRAIARVTEHPVRAGAIGFVGGALTQSTSAMTFIVISLVTSGMITLPKGLPIVTWANLGTSVLVMLATLDMHVAILFLLGITGLGFYADLDRSSRYRYLLNALLGVGMLFYGLEMIKTGAAPLQEIELVRTLLAMASQSMLLGFVIGVLVTLVVQSSATVSVISVTLISVGLLTFDQSVMIVFGASLGSGLSVLLLSGNLAGRGRQLALFQVVLKGAGLALLLPIFLIDQWTAEPVVDPLLRQLAPSIDTRVALIYLSLQLAACIAMTLFAKPAIRLIERLSPPSQEEALATPFYLYPQAMEEAQSALDLVEREQARLIRRLPLYLNPIRDEQEPTSSSEEPETREVDLVTLHRASAAVAAACATFLTELTERTGAHSALERSVNLKSRNDLLLQLQDSCFELSENLSAENKQPAARRLRQNIAEGLHALLETFAQGLLDDPDTDFDLLRELSSDRHRVMERVRADLLSSSETIATSQKHQLLNATNLVERITWLARRYIKLLQRQR